MSAPSPDNVALGHKLATRLMRQEGLFVAQSIAGAARDKNAKIIAKVLAAAEQRAEARIVTFLRKHKVELIDVAAQGWELAADMIERRKHMESA